MLACVGFGQVALAQCERVRLQAPDGAADDRLGNDIRIEGNRMVVGAQLDDHSGFVDAGAAYVYVRSGNNWVYEDKLIANSPHDGDRFGWSVDISGDLIVVGARDDSEFGTQSGAVYVFRRNNSDWVQEARLFAGDPEEFAQFGSSVAIDGDGILVGAPKENLQHGAAYVFRREGNAWSQEAKLGSEFGGEGGDQVGYAVALDGHVAMLGAPQVEDPGQPGNHGVVFVHRRVNGVWTFEQKLRSTDLLDFEDFGNAVDVQGDRALIGKWHDAANGANSGSAYVFEYNGQAWVQTQKLLPFDGEAEQLFGVDLGLDGDNLVIGARGDNELGTQAGAAYLFSRSGGVWLFNGKLHASDSAPEDLYGNSTDISADVVAVGSPRHDSGRGMVYVNEIGDCNPTLTVDATCPDGGPIRVSWENATPNSQVAILFAVATGAFVIPNGYACEGTRLGLGWQGIHLVHGTSFGSGADGSRTLFSNTTAEACGGYLQLLDLATCRVSNTARVE
ncbi:MAG: hypothetical protein IT430_08740 [Phycisphaerales bacterium]|nr:hypothetical protein [Phycisphaerales bacterium]